MHYPVNLLILTYLMKAWVVALPRVRSTRGRMLGLYILLLMDACLL